MTQSEQELKDFIVLVHTNTYASGDENRTEPSRPSSTDYKYEQGEYGYRDIYFGNRRFIGGEVVFINKKPVWAMNYAGFLDSASSKSVVWSFLKKVLKVGVEKKEFLRGPEVWTTEIFKYECEWEGDFTLFTGTEKIYFKKKLIYTGYFHGGTIQE